MKFLLIMHMNPQIWEALTEDERNEVMKGHEDFIETIRESGEMLGTTALAEPAESVVVRVRGGAPTVSDGPYLEAKEYLGGYYLIECADRDRAVELAALIPDARVEGLGVEIREVIFSAGAEAASLRVSGAAATS
ncbi:YciI family protein [Micromonospora echinofusca]|uniref:YciI family protein n=1 Tax=Micromonospora echinofusca TaxID=47858 RepID=UPI000C712AA3|nr:YciI family protein [Micromonospora sp. MSM11]MCL7455810.1 YciI family protein [Micromonospora sp. MSM11]